MIKTYQLPSDLIVSDDNTLIPGNVVHYFNQEKTTYGIVISVTTCELAVLWSQYPRHDFSNLVFPVVKKVFSALISNDIVSIQPMTLKPSTIFYLDIMQTGSKII